MIGNPMRRRRPQRVLTFIALISLLSILPGLGATNASPSYAQLSGWSTPILLSEELEHAWFPYVAVDYAGGVHVIWNGVDSASGIVEGSSLLYYTSRRGETWSTPNDVAVSGDIVRAALAADDVGRLHMVHQHYPRMYYKRASVEDAWSAAAWTSPRVIGRSNSYLPDIAIDSQGVIHIVWTKSAGRMCSDCFPVFYRRSADGGRTWSRLRELSPGQPLRFRLQIKLDLEDNIYVVWDEVVDEANVVSSTYVLSSDAGESWSAPVQFESLVGRSKQATMGVDGQGNVVAVWRTDQDDYIYRQLSSDGGVSWSAPAAIGGILARSRLFNDTGLDKYDMATDSGGNLHLVVVGRTSESEDPPGVYHLQWDGASWSPPTLVFAEPDLFPEYPSIAIGEGNRLHAVWFTRDRDHVWDAGNGVYEVWYGSAFSTAPHVTARSTPLPSPISTPTPTVTPTTTASPTVQESARESASGNGHDWHSVSTYPLAVAIAPMALLLLGLVLARSRRMFR